MAPVVIVDVQEVCEGFDAFGLGFVGTDVSPFFKLGAVESFDFAIGLGSVGAGAPALHVLAQRVTEVETSIAPTVVRQDLSHFDPVITEPVRELSQKSVVVSFRSSPKISG